MSRPVVPAGMCGWQWECSASTGGIIPISPCRRRRSNRSMYPAAAIPRSSIDFHGPLVRSSSVLNSESNVSARALSYGSPGCRPKRPRRHRRDGHDGDGCRSECRPSGKEASRHEYTPVHPAFFEVDVRIGPGGCHRCCRSNRNAMSPRYRFNYSVRKVTIMRGQRSLSNTHPVRKRCFHPHFHPPGGRSQLGRRKLCAILVASGRTRPIGRVRCNRSMRDTEPHTQV